MFWTCQTFHSSHKKALPSRSVYYLPNKGILWANFKWCKCKCKKTKKLLIYNFVLNWKVPVLQIVTMKYFKLTKTIRAPRYLIATSLMINSSSILGVFASVEFRSQSDLSVPGMLCSLVTSLSIWVLVMSSM